MWGYYGSKSKIAHLYPPPLFDTVIEPFAGTAQYALCYFDRRVILVEKYAVIANLWKWLQRCSPKDILETPILRCGETTESPSFSWDCQERKDLVGFLIGAASVRPKKTATRWKTVVRPNTQAYKLKLIARSLYKIRHWEILEGDYRQSPDVEATWFVDPPYRVGGVLYKHGSNELDYPALAAWCKSRQGQVLVCEAEGQDWLPFFPFVSQRGCRKTCRESLWSNLPLPASSQIFFDF